jgi:integrase
MARITDWDGIQKTPYGYLVRVSVSPFPRRGKRFPATASHDEMIRWRNAQRQVLERSRPRAAHAGTVAADVASYLSQWGTGKHPQTVEQRKRHLRLFAEAFGSRLRATLTTQEIEAQLRLWQRDGLPLSEFSQKRGRRQQALSHAAIRKVRQSIYQLYAVLDRGSEASNPVAHIPAGADPDADPRGLPMPVVRQILAQLPRGKPKARCYLMAYIGLRPDEVRLVRETDADWRRRTLYVRSAKGSERTRVPLTHKGAAALRYFARLQAFGPFTAPHVNRLLHEAAERAGFPDIEIDQYTLRHSFGTAHYAACRDIKATKEAMRHKSIRMTERYVRGSVTSVLEASIAQLDAALRSTR